MTQGDGSRAEELAGKVLTAVAVAAGAWLLFQGIMRGIFSLMMGGNSENGVYVLFYGGGIALVVIAVLGAAAGWLFWRRARKGPAAAAAPAQERSMLRSGITMGLALVAGAALLLLALFAWILTSV